MERSPTMGEKTHCCVINRFVFKYLAVVCRSLYCIRTTKKKKRKKKLNRLRWILFRSRPRDLNRERENERGKKETYFILFESVSRSVEAHQCCWKRVEAIVPVLGYYKSSRPPELLLLLYCLYTPVLVQRRTQLVVFHSFICVWWYPHTARRHVEQLRFWIRTHSTNIFRPPSSELFPIE